MTQKEMISRILDKLDDIHTISVENNQSINHEEYGLFALAKKSAEKDAKHDEEIAQLKEDVGELKTDTKPLRIIRKNWFWLIITGGAGGTTFGFWDKIKQFIDKI